MSISSNLKTKVDALIVTRTPLTVSASDRGTCELTVDFTTIESLSCSLSELRLEVPSLAGSGTAELQQWAADLCSKITYLLEDIGTLEIDPNSQQVLIRSTPPDQQDDGTRFYEILLASQHGGRFSLRRYESTKGTAGRIPVDLKLTHEVLYKLVDDLVATIP